MPTKDKMRLATELPDVRPFTIVSGNGFPSYLRVVRDAAFDVQGNRSFGTLVVSIDAE